ncbi:uncharacterized protein LOC116251005 [Nymphaea colorata]|nr:uncharacterized protein LOC116251005 [Nymphaea colorata]
MATMDLVPYRDSNSEASPSPQNLPWQEMFRSASVRRPPGLPTTAAAGTSKGGTTAEAETSPEAKPPPPECPPSKHASSALTTNPQLSLALYIAMAHAGLVLGIVLLFGIAKLLEEYLRPIAWAVLCSMPLREIQSSLEDFWTYPLNLGVLETALAVPVAIFRASMSTMMDMAVVGRRMVLWRSAVDRRERRKIGFSKLVQWLVSFGFFLFMYEWFGVGAVLAFAFLGFLATKVGIINAESSCTSTLSAIYSVRKSRSLSKKGILSRVSRSLTSGILSRLKTIVALGLILGFIFGVLFGGLFFSYKIAVEGKEAVISLKVHMQENDYAEKLGIKQWMEENDVPKLMDTYTSKFYEMVSEQIDLLAAQYNLTEFVDGFKHFMNKSNTELVDSGAPTVQQHHYVEKLHIISTHAQNREWKGIYMQLSEMLHELLMTREDLVDKAKAFALEGIDVMKRVFDSSKSVLGGGASFLVSIVLSIFSGAANFLNFISHSIVFFWLLYYLITSESGGVMDHVLGMLPVSMTTRRQCAEVLDHAISSVLLATAKVAFFQGCFTWLLFRFYQIHFLYMSTVIALVSPLLPIFPSWISSIPAAAQLVLEGRYIEAVIISVAHQVLMDFGASAIQEDIPGQSGYLTGLSILGGMALFSSALEGAIMGPLLMTVMIALKNLYTEFVLAAAKEKEQ